MDRQIATHIETLEDVAEAMTRSESKASIIYKHSPACGLGDMAIREMERFASELPLDAALYCVDVLGSRAASLKIEELAGVRHESPQVLFILNRTCVWHASHSAIKFATLRKASELIIRLGAAPAAFQ